MTDYEPRITATRRALHEVPTLGGVERGLAILNGTFCVCVVMGTHMVSIIPVSVAMHFVLAWVTKKDPYTIRVYARFAKQADCYDPWPRPNQRHNARPKGFGKGLLC